MFRGNQNLGREESQNVEAGVEFVEGNIAGSMAVFYREDNDLTDWTFSSAGPDFAARSANPVDIDVLGVETILRGDWDYIDAVLGYTYLHKDENYGIADVDASFYALNFPTNRVTASFIIKPTNQLRILIDNEYRNQIENSLRNGRDEAFFTSMSVSYFPEMAEWLEVGFAFDNIFNENFEEVPGVPGARRQFSVFTVVRW